MCELNLEATGDFMEGIEAVQHSDYSMAVTGCVLSGVVRLGISMLNRGVTDLPFGQKKPD